MVSFGIAPSILGYVFVYRNFYFWATLALFIYLLCSVVRLAKYNITAKEKLANYFYGLPTTVSGGILASFILIYRKRQESFFLPFIFLIIVVFLAFLMVSRVKYLNLDGLKELFGKRLRLVVLFMAILLILAGFLRKSGVVLFTFFLIYLLFSPVVIKRLNHNS